MITIGRVTSARFASSILGNGIHFLACLISWQVLQKLELKILGQNNNQLLALEIFPPVIVQRHKFDTAVFCNYAECQQVEMKSQTSHLRHFHGSVTFHIRKELSNFSSYYNNGLINFTVNTTKFFKDKIFIFIEKHYAKVPHLNLALHAATLL